MRYENHVPAKAAYWSKQVDQWEKSGLLQKDYCAKYGLGLKSFGRWRRILKPSERNVTATKGGAIAASLKQLIPLSVLADTETHSTDEIAQHRNAGIRLHAWRSRDSVGSQEAGFLMPHLRSARTLRDKAAQRRFPS